MGLSGNTIIADQGWEDVVVRRGQKSSYPINLGEWATLIVLRTHTHTHGMDRGVQKSKDRPKSQFDFKKTSYDFLGLTHDF